MSSLFKYYLHRSPERFVKRKPGALITVRRVFILVELAGVEPASREGKNQGFYMLSLP